MASTPIFSLRMVCIGDSYCLKEILKKGALTVIQTVVHLSNSCGYTNSRASNPPFLKLL
jgi:hypothetical protein